MRIEYVSPPGKGRYVIVRRLDASHFVLSKGSRLGGFPIATTFTQPRALKPDGQHDYDVFAFTLLSNAALAGLRIGAEVVLENLDTL
jgi:hypothetical protein